MEQCHRNYIEVKKKLKVALAMGGLIYKMVMIIKIPVRVHEHSKYDVFPLTQTSH